MGTAVPRSFVVAQSPCHNVYAAKKRKNDPKRTVSLMPNASIHAKQPTRTYVLWGMYEACTYQLYAIDIKAGEQNCILYSGPKAIHIIHWTKYQHPPGNPHHARRHSSDVGGRKAGILHEREEGGRSQLRSILVKSGKREDSHKVMKKRGAWKRRIQ